MRDPSRSGRGSPRRGRGRSARARETLDRGAALDADAGTRARLDARIRAFQPGGRRADVPGGGAAPHSRRGDARRADRRQGRWRRMARPCRAIALAVRQRRDLGAVDHRPARRYGRREGARGHVDPPDRALGRADHPRRRRYRDARARRAIRLRPDDRGGARQREAAGGARIPLFLRHARRGGGDVGGRGALSPIL